MSNRYFVLGVFAIINLSVVVLRAQTNTENFAQLQFNFNNPGARANAIGGAFISIADDATAAEANPAGLTALLKPEVSFELKSISFKRDVFNFSHDGSPQSFTLIERQFKNSVISPSFISVVYPLKGMTLSAFRHELVNFESSFFTRGPLAPGISTPNLAVSFFPVVSETNIKVVNLGLAGGYKINSKLSIGVAGGFSQLDVNSSLKRFKLEIFDSSTLDSEAVIDDSDSDFFINIGAIYKASEQLSVGAMFKKRPGFTLEHSLTDLNFPVTFLKDVGFNVPSSFGFGVSYRPSDALTLAGDVVRVTYSDLVDNFQITAAQAIFNSDDYSVDDGIELHLGGEYVGFWQNLGYVLRGGIFVEPDNNISFAGSPSGSSQFETNQRGFHQLLFQEGDTNLNVTFGIGLLPPGNIQIDVAGNLSKRSDALVASIVYRLK